MRQLRATLTLCLVCLASHARAQDSASDRGRFKLNLDAQLIGYRRQVIDITYAGTSLDGETYKSNDVVFGPFNGGGIGMGYAVTEYLVPQLYLSMQGKAEKSSPYEARDEHNFTYQFAPQVELVKPRSKVAPYAMAGIGFSGYRAKINGDDEFGTYQGSKVRSFAIGPTLSAGVHRFLVPRAALDFCFRFNSAFLLRANGNKNPEPADQRTFEIIFLLGTSFWL